MPLWIVLSFLAAISFACTNVIDKIIIDKHVRRPYIVVLFLGCFDILFGLGILLIGGSGNPTPSELIWVLFAGLLDQIGAYLYFFAIAREEVSRIVPIFYFSPFIVAILARFWFGETFSPFVYLGFFSLVIGALFINVQPNKKIKLGAPFFMMIVSMMAYSCAFVIEKYSTFNLNNFPLLGWLFLGMGISTLPLFWLQHNNLSSLTRSEWRQIFSWTWLAGCISVLSYFILISAISRGPATLVDALLSTQAFFVLALTIILSIHQPKHLQESINGHSLGYKVAGIMSMSIGACLIIISQK